MQLGVALVGALLTITALALAVLTSLLHWVTVNHAHAIESLRISQALQLRLTAHSRALLFSVAKEGTLYVPAAAATEQRIRRLLVEAGEHISAPGERELVDRATAAVNAYIESTHAVEARPGSSAERLEIIGPPFDAAFDAIDSLVWLNVDHARALRERAISYDTAADAMSGAVIALSLLTVGGLILSLRKSMFGALASLHAAVVRFTAGDSAARAPVEGAREVQEVASAFNEMADTLTRWYQSHLTFLMGIAQDLRDPLTVIKLLQRAPDVRGVIAPGSPEAVFDEQIVRMDRMLRDLIDGVLIAGGKLDLALEKRDLRPLVEAAVADYRALSPERSISLSMPGGPVLVSCDAARVEHVVANLVSNALKYSSPDHPVRVVVAQQRNQATIEVIDEGIGIPHDDVDRIFEPFRRRDVSHGVVSGSGLGLRATKAIIEAHGGSLEVESEPGRGSTFRVSLPVIVPA